MPTIEITNKIVYYEEHGNGDPLLLIAGLSSDSQSWQPIVSKLTKHYRVIVFDNVGVGRSSSDNSDRTIEKMSDDCVELMKKLGISSFNILGHSMGGMIAMSIAIQYPSLVKNLILEATSPKINNRNIKLFQDWVEYQKSGMEKHLWFRNVFYWILSPQFFNNRTILDQAIEMSINYPYPQSISSFENQVEAISTFNCQSQTIQITASTLIIFGENDILFPTSETEKLFENIVDAKTVTIPNAAHSIHLENPEAISEEIIDFISK